MREKPPVRVDDATLRPILERFAERFVLPSYRERILVDALTKRGRLEARISHAIDGVFPSRFRGLAVAPDASAPCVAMFDSYHAFLPTTWGVFRNDIEGGGGGVLAIATDASWFFAQSEGYPPPETYSGTFRP